MLEGPHRLQLVGGDALGNGCAMAGDDCLKIEFALQLSVGGDKVLGLFNRRQPVLQCLAVNRCVPLVIESLSGQSQGGGKLGAGGEKMPRLAKANPRRIC